MQLFLVRHPRPQVAHGVCYGRTDIPLLENAAIAAARLKPLLPNVPLFSSPLTRCRQLAEALHPAPVSDERLRELDFGRWEMQSWDAIGRDTIDAWAANPLDFDAHGGESVATLRRRVLACIEDIRAQHEAAVLVVHAGVMKVLAAELLGLPDSAWFSMNFDFATVSLIEDGRLVWLNEPAESESPTGGQGGTIRHGQ